MLHTFSAQQTETPSSTDSEVFRMSGWYGSMDMGGLGHPHDGGGPGEFFRAHGVEEENAVGMSYSELHPQQSVVTTATSSSGYSMKAVAKKAGYGLVAGAVIGMVLLRVPMYNNMMTKDKSWQAAAVGAAIAVPLASMYA